MVYTASTDVATHSVLAPGRDADAVQLPTIRNRSDASVTSIATSSDQDLERLGDEIAELAAHVHAATYRLLVRLREFEARDGWTGGFRSCAHWLSWRTGIGLGAAREKVRVARALEQLPLLSAAMRRGELSFAKIRAATRVATPENEHRLLDLARHGTASHVEKVVRAWRRADRLAEQADERERHRSRELTLYVDDDGMYVLRGRLDPEVGALLEQALAAAGEALYGRTGAPEGRAADAAAGIDPATFEQRRADAVGLVAECALKELETASYPQTHSTSCPHTDATNCTHNDATFCPHTGTTNEHPAVSATVRRADRFQVVVHVDAEALVESSDAGQSVLANGQHVSAETSRRLACDATRVVMTRAGDGTVLDVGRRRRTVPPAIRRALEHRDRGCRFPGCGVCYCDAHHVVHWADGGPTRLSNIVLLCRVHHRAVHEEGFRVEITHAGEVRFYTPDGRLLPETPHAPRLPHDPVAALAAAHRRLDLEIDASTAASRWAGERLDAGFAVLTLRGP